MRPREAFDNKMKDSVRAFYDMTASYYPELVSGEYDQAHQDEVKEKLKRETHNDMTFANSGRIMSALKELRKSRRRDAKNQDYLKRQAFPEDLHMDETQFRFQNREDWMPFRRE